MAPCPHRPACPGCPDYGASLDASAALPRLSLLAAEQGVIVEPIPGPQFGYRHRARLAIRGRAASPKVGIFQQGSHRIVDIPRCVVHHPRVNAVAAALRGAIRESGAPPYADGPHRGLLRYLQVMVDPQGEGSQLVVVCNDRAPDAAAPLLQALRQRLGAGLHSLFWNGQPERSNAILGPHWAHICGPEALSLSVGGARAFFPPAAFAQNNLPTYTRIVEWVHARVPDGARVAELYAGVGSIGLGLAARCGRVRFNELSEGSLRGLRMGIAALPADAASRTEVVPGEAGGCLPTLTDSDVVIVDPPRRGLDRPLLDALCARPAATLLYVSCGLGSFERDAAALLSAGFRLAELAAADLFPFTGHVETLARFEPPAGPANAQDDTRA